MSQISKFAVDQGSILKFCSCSREDCSTRTVCYLKCSSINILQLSRTPQCVEEQILTSELFIQAMSSAKKTLRKTFSQLSSGRKIDKVLACREPSPLAFAPLSNFQTDIQRKLLEKYHRGRESYAEQVHIKEGNPSSNRRFWCFITAFTGLYAYGLYRARDSENQLLRIGAAGSLTMLINDITMYSVESINARQKMIRGENVSMVDMTKRILKSEGLAGMYRGYSASFYSIITHGFFYMYFYKAIKQHMKNHFKPETHLGRAAIYAASSTLAQSVDLFCYPFEMVRIRMLTMREVYGYASVSDAFRKIIADEGIKGMYKGGACYFANLIGVYSLSLTLYEHFIDRAIARRGLSSFKEQETKYVIYASVLSSLITVLITNSMEVIVVRRQGGSQDSIRQMFKEEGVKNMLCKGLGAKCVHAVIGGTMFYLTMNRVEKIFNVNLSDEDE